MHEKRKKRKHFYLSNFETSFLAVKSVMTNDKEKQRFLISFHSLYCQIRAIVKKLERLSKAASFSYFAKSDFANILPCCDFKVFSLTLYGTAIEDGDQSS